MAIKTLQNVTETPSGVQILNMGQLKESHPELFPNGGNQMDLAVFEETIRPHNYIYVRDDVNSLSFTLQNGPIKENGVNGCQVTDVLEVCRMIIAGLNEQFPCRENAITLTKLDEALLWQGKRTQDRERRGVEGQSKV